MKKTVPTEQAVLDTENQFKQALKGRWGLFLHGRISLDGDFDASELRQIADIVDRMHAQGLELVESSADPDWEDDIDE